MSTLKLLMEKNFIDYASYVIIDRAIPDLRDGCKPVQRRILNTLFEMNDSKFHKVANVIGETMKLHPHGDASIGDALVVLANKEYFIEKQGNFGNIVTGHDAAAARYIECRLSQLAVDTLFNKSITEYIDSYDGRKQEPSYLPAKLPVLLMMGTEGIAVGMATRILPHNFIELLHAQVAILENKTAKVYPDFPTGGLIDVSEYADGLGKIKVRAKIDEVNPKKLVIREIPFSTTTTSLIASIEAAAQRGKVSVGSINDFTTDKVEIELNLARGATADEVIPQLFAYTDCEVTINSNIVTIHNNHPTEISVTDYLKIFTAQLKKTIKAELEYELQQLIDRQHWLTLEQIFIENRIYKRIETAKTEEAIREEVYKGLKPFKHLFIREVIDDDIKRLLELRIRRISAFDIEKHRKEIDDIVAAMKRINKQLRALTETTITYLDGLIKKYKDVYVRRSRITSIETIDKKEVAKADVKLSYDPATGFFGSSIRNSEYQMTVTEFDRILTITNDGTYRIMAPAEKVFLPGKLLYCGVFNPETGFKFTMIYRDKDNVPWGKVVHIEKFITDKVYKLYKDAGDIENAQILYFRRGEVAEKVKLYFIPVKRQKLSEFIFNVKELLPAGIPARGMQVHPKGVEKIVLLTPPKTAATETPIDNNGKDNGNVNGKSAPDLFDTQDTDADSSAKTKSVPSVSSQENRAKPATKLIKASPEKPGKEKAKKAAAPAKSGKSTKSKSTGKAKPAVTAKTSSPKKAVKKPVKGKTSSSAQKPKKTQKKTKKG